VVNELKLIFETLGISTRVFRYRQSENSALDGTHSLCCLEFERYKRSSNVFAEESLHYSHWSALSRVAVGTLEMTA
jgi:hypothetical protein